MQIKDAIGIIEEKWPIKYAEDFDNVGLIIGDPNNALKGVLICHDSTEIVIDEAVEKNCNLIVSFHPIIFKGLKKINGGNYVERAIVKAIKNDIAIYSIHTALDNHWEGVNDILLAKLGAIKKSVLIQQKSTLLKLSTYVPKSQAQDLMDKLFAAGAGKIGNYDSCSFSVEGTGSFRALDGSNPFVGEKGKIHREQEVNLNVVVPVDREKSVVKALLDNHPYEEVAYEIYELKNSNSKIGLGMVAEMEKEWDERDFLLFLKKSLPGACIKHSKLLGKGISKIAVLGGSGAFAIEAAKASGADIFISADFKYHDFFAADNRIILADIGHYESEQFTKYILFEHLSKKITKFAVALSEYNTNPINYL